MPEPILSPEQWEAVKLSNITGVPDTELADQWGVTCESIRQRRCRDAIWKAAFDAKGGACHSVSQKTPETASLAKKVASTISESAEGLSASNLLLASQIAKKGLQRASGEIDHLAIENIADVERIFKMAALAGKWSQPIVNVNQAFAFGGGQDDQNIIECDMEIMEDGNNYGDSFNL